MKDSDISLRVASVFQRIQSEASKHKKYAPLLMLSVLIITMAGFTLLIPVNKKITHQTLVSANRNNISAPTSLSPTRAPSQKVAVQNHVTPTTQPLPTLDPGVSWNTYINLQYGYAIKYSPAWSWQDLGSLEPKIPSYIVFNPITASASSRFVTISVSTRSYQEQLAIGGAGTPITVAGIDGVKQLFQDSNGFKSTAIVLPRTNNLLIFRAKKDYETFFEVMLSTVTVTK